MASLSSPNALEKTMQELFDDAEIVLPVGSPRAFGARRFALQGIYLRTFSSQMMLLRPDYSLALTGFVGAEIGDDHTGFGDGGRVREEFMKFDEEAMQGCVEEDTYYRATFVWRLRKNDYVDDPSSAGTVCSEPCFPVKGGCKPYDDNRKIFDKRFLNNMWQELEEARLGMVLVKA
ncbi:hypothetical protein C7974DRAFT_469323 [Boeremia exigua]|uniref:uncharacterized protein n=1 Tax=Boeremia exigua TaxID=749465 RepID=UPI001E8EBF3F|nr:uncharacterized protein C7974DRAFT_469323 [Boeremia exigua]KAH6643136.1 hypothetical protein C7974DRAFT_469323 [Boeremia exigua]